MNSLTDHDQDAPTATPDREITLGTTLLLGIFFGLAALCAAFFGFGYSLGAKHTNVVSVASEAQPSLRLNGTKPAAGSAAPIARTAPDPTDKPASRPETTSPKPTVEAAPAAPPSRSRPSPEAEPAPPAPTASTPASTLGATPFLVQIAAVTHQEDADLIASTLTRRGYAVNIRSEPQDKLLHVQVGPFASKKDAEAMRQRLMADGFNAYIK